MPFYEYQCKNCGHELEAMQKVSDGPLKKCPHCGKSQLQRLMSAPVFRLKGSGWYETDFKDDKDKKRNLADKPDADAKGETETKAETKTDTKDEAKATDSAPRGRTRPRTRIAFAKAGEKTADPKPEPKSAQARTDRGQEKSSPRGGEKDGKSEAPAATHAVLQSSGPSCKG